MGDSPKWVKSRRRRKKKERERERLNNGENNGQATHGARKHAWRTQAAWANSENNFNFWRHFLTLMAKEMIFLHVGR